MLGAGEVTVLSGGRARPSQGVGQRLFGALDHTGVELGVAPGVLGEVVAPHEALLAQGTAELLLARVRPVVARQLVRARELFKAVWPRAGEGPLTCEKGGKTGRGDTAHPRSALSQPPHPPPPGRAGGTPGTSDSDCLGTSIKPPAPGGTEQPVQRSVFSKHVNLLFYAAGIPESLGHSYWVAQVLSQNQNPQPLADFPALWTSGRTSKQPPSRSCDPPPAADCPGRPVSMSPSLVTAPSPPPTGKLACS